MNKKELKIKCYTEKELDKNIKTTYFKLGLDIANLKYSNINKKQPKLNLLIFMCENKKIMTKYIKKLIKYRKILAKNFELLNIVLVSFDEQNQIHKQFKELIPAIYSTKLEYIYDKAYDLACDYLDSYFYGKNLCDFCNNKCGYKLNFELDCGCCRHFEKHKRLGLLFGEKLVPCNELGPDGHCTIKCMRCKLFSCEYLNKKGINFNTGSIFSLYSIFNPLQRLALNSIAYIDKPDILKIVNFLR